MSRILYAEDNDDLRKAVARALSRLGHEVIALNNAARAWELLQEGERFDLIISDFEMPEMDGVTFLTKVRRNPDIATTPFAVLSGCGDETVARRVTEMGARYFSKRTVSVKDMVSEMLSL